MARILPVILFSLLSGAVADSYNRRQAMMLSFTDVFRLLALLFLGLVPLLLLMKSPRRGRPSPGATH